MYSIKRVVKVKNSIVFVGKFLFLVNTPWSCHGDKASSKNINA